MKIELQSPAFKEGEVIPAKYTCDGEDISPPLSWSPLPEGTRSIALICDDPDAPMGTWVHWVLYNLPPESRSLPENFPKDARLEDGTCQGMTDFGRPGYGGPCPPVGTHRYYFRIYALDTLVDLKPGAGKAGLLRAMKEHLLAEGELMGRYQRT